MNIVLSVMCGLAILFAGGCILLSGGTAILLIIPVVMVTGNIAILALLWGWWSPSRPQIRRLAILDFLAAGSLALLTWYLGSSPGWQGDGGNWLAGGLIAALFVKGLFTMLVLDETG